MPASYLSHASHPASGMHWLNASFVVPSTSARWRSRALSSSAGRRWRPPRPASTAVPSQPARPIRPTIMSAEAVNVVPPGAIDWGHSRGAALKRLATERVPFSDVELDEVLASLREAAGVSNSDEGGVTDNDAGVDWAGLRAVLASAAHRPHKEWAVTAAAATKARTCLLRGRPLGDPRSDACRRMWTRVLEEGNWDGAVAAATAATAAAPADGVDTRPWAVLVTGVNGIRKTTSLYQPWFPAVLESALAAAGHPSVDARRLPTGESSWFRQLDHLIATIAAAEFRRLYAGPNRRAAAGSNGILTLPPVDAYAAHKDGIFARYRTVAEVLGAALVTEAAATAGGLNVLVETSGRDVAMFSYFDAIFPEGAYRKLALHFTVNTVEAAAASVAARMAGEMKVGAVAAAGGGGIHAIIAANAGGPYGPEVLPDVQADAERVWAQVAAGVREGTGAAAGWWTARVAIDAQLEPAGWAAQAAAPDGKRVGHRHDFIRLEY